MLFHLVLALVAVVAGGIAAVSGFGIGSLLTPTLALATGTKLAVAAIAVPHFVATVQRFWILRRHVDRRVLLGFGIASAVGGLAGALAHTDVSSRSLTVVFGVLLLLAGASQLTGWMEHVRWGRASAWVAGLLSGVLGGLVGNQGGIRSAAMLGFDVPKEAFVATATAVGIFVDVARLPVYVATEGHAIASVWPFVLIATIGAVIGTVLGTRLLGHLPPRAFRQVIGVLLVLLGVYMIVAGGAHWTPPSLYSGGVRS
ncbi:MAG TPA: sulfite exporter TauE/SafE family protein [Gemmatimonadaceae bacterium]